MKSQKLALLGGVAAIALGLTGTAQAFDQVNWTWNQLVEETITKIINIDVSFNPSGLVNVELAQLHIGDVSANAEMSNVHNDPTFSYEERTFDFTATGSTSGSLGVEGSAEGFVDIDFGQWTSGCGVDGDSVCEGPGNEDDRVGLIGIAGNPAGESLTENGVSGVFGSEAPLDVSGSTTGSLDVQVSGQVTVPALVALDAALELPTAENIATALGNNGSIESNRMVEMHAGQFLLGGGSESNGDGFDPAVAAVGFLYGHLEHEGVNTHQSAATALTAAAILGVVDPSEVTATASMSNVSQLQATNAATAIGNNLSVDLAAETPDDGILIGDITQFAFADITATASMNNVNVSNYSNLGAIEGPLFSNVATAIGNNLSIKVAGPNVTVPGNGGGGVVGGGE